MGSQKNCSKVACSPDNMCAVQFVFGVEGVKVKVDEQTESTVFYFWCFLKTKTPLVLPVPSMVTCPGTGTAQCTYSTHSFISVLLQMY